uniref:hypothetical protein n=1 Tax=Aquiflexum sp. TaxID=1872584 RepID=UPI00359344AE
MSYNYPTFIQLLKTIVFSLVFFLGSHDVFAQAPTTPSSNLNISNIDGDRFYASFTRGNGARRIIIASTSPVTAVPVNGADYLAGNYGLGNEISQGQFVVYNGTANQTWIYGFNHSTTYHLKIFEYNGTNFTTEYLTAEFLEGSATTLTAPTVQASALTFSNVTGSGMSLSWTNGNGNGRVIIGKADGPVDAEPQDLTNYGGGSGSFTNGTNLGNGNFVQYSGGGSGTNLSGLDPSRTYHFAIFEYTGSSGRV